MKSGFVAIIGRPNVGKSTIINSLIGQKISIVSAKAQTTRNIVRGIYDDKDCQIIFIDTPGVHKPRQKLGEEMNKSVFRLSEDDIDAILLVVDASLPFGIGDEFLLEKIKKYHCPIFVVLNKIDLVTITQIEAIKKIYNEKLPKAIQIETVATEGFNNDELIKKIKEILPDGPLYYDLETKTDTDVVFQIKEIIREKTLITLKEEVPHSIAVYVDNIEWEDKPMLIEASIVVEKDSQKGILIGSKGKMIKRIGKLARIDIEKELNKHIYLDLTVKVDPDWRNNPQSLKKFGYKVDKK